MINEVVKKQDDTLADLEQYVANRKQYNIGNTNLISEILSENNNVVQVANTVEFMDRNVATLLCKDIESLEYNKIYTDTWDEFIKRNSDIDSNATFNTISEDKQKIFLSMMKEALSSCPKIAGYQLIDFRHDEQSGIQAGLYKNIETGEYTVVCRGTEFSTDTLEFYKDFVLRDIMEVGMNKIPSDLKIAEELLAEARKLVKEDNNGKSDDSKIHITGHSLGGAIAQLLGATIGNENIDVTTFNPVGVKHLIDNISEKGKFRSDAETAANIMNYATNSDFVSLIFDSIGNKIKLVEPREKDPTKIDFAELYFLAEMGIIDPDDVNLMQIFHDETYADNGHKIENFISTDSFEAFQDSDQQVPQTLAKILRTLLGGTVTIELIACLVCALTKDEHSLTVKALRYIFAKELRGEEYSLNSINTPRLTLYASISITETFPEYNYVAQFFVEAGIKYVIKSKDNDDNLRFYLANNINELDFEEISSENKYFEAYIDGYEIAYDRNFNNNTIYVYKENDYLIEYIQNLLDKSNTLDIAILNDDNYYGDYTIIGDSKDNFLEGFNGKTIAYAGKGNDVVIGSGGQDELHGQEGDDILIAGNTQMSEEELKNIIQQKNSINTANFESENGITSELYGDEGDDLLIGDKGDDNLYGGKDNDYLYGGRGNDNLYGEDNDDHLYGGEGDDELDGGDGDDTLEAGEGNYKDTLKGGKGNDKLITQNGNNQLEGGEDNDTYEANGGINNIEDESGFDTYKLTHSGSYVINDHDRSGQVFLSGAFVYGSPNNEPITDGYWEENGISYRWAGAGSTLFINNNIQIKNFYNGDYGINLREKDPEPEEPEDADNLDSEPIVLDLNGDGVRTTSKNQGINVDINGDGFAERVAWADINDGVLVADKNNNGIIDDESEIITAETLASYDTNNDGKIDSNDENYSELKVAKVDGSMQSLEDAGVESIDTNVNQTDYTDENGNYRFGEGSFTRTDGSVGSFGEYYFDTDYKNTVEKEILPETTTVQKLPDIKSRGTLHSLHQAMLRDSDLTALIQDFVNSNDDNHRHELIEQILNKWAGCEDVDVTSRGDFVNAKHLAIWEALMGKPFVSTNPGEENPLNPNKEAAEIIETVYTRLKVEVYAQLMKQSHFSMYMDLIGESVNGKYDLTELVNVLNDAITVNEEVGKNLVVQVAEMLLGLNIMYNSNYFDPFEDNCFYTKFTENDRELKWLLDSIGKNITDPIVKDMGGYDEDYGTAGSNAMRDKDETVRHTYHSLGGNDALYGGSADDYFAGCNGRDIVDGGDGDDHLLGNGNQDWVFGGKGNDILLGGADNDILFGGDGDDIIYPDLEGEVDEADRVHGPGNDIIKGGKGNDTVYSIFGNETYIFNLGDGQDTISDISGTDIIYFGDGISWDDLTFEQNLNDLIIRINNSEDSITIVNWFFRTTLYDYSNNFKIEMFKFADGSIHYKNEIPIETDVEAFQFIGSDNNDWFKTGDFYKNYVNAGRGNDFVEAGTESDDTYVYNIGDGYDSILDNGGNDTILLGEGITQDNIRFRRNENSLEMYFEGIEGNINILKTSNMIERIVLADGTVIDDISQYLTCDISYTSYIMGDNLYELKLLGGAAKNVLGNNSNNRIEGGEGSHVIASLGGDDEIHCEKGSSDTYIYNIGDGNDNITDFNGFDNVIFGEGITTENIRFERHDNNLIIYFDGFEGSIYINNYFTNEGRIENFVFADGTVLDNVDNRLFAIGSNNDDIYLPEGASNAYLWGEADISATGNSQDNWFSGNSGNNTYQGREGNDGIWDDQGGNDTYIYNIGDGYDNIFDYNGYDEIRFGEGITSDIIRMSRIGGDLNIYFDGIEGNILIQNYFNDENNRIEKIVLADGSEYTDFNEFMTYIETDSDYTISEDSNIRDVYATGNVDTTLTGNSQDNHFEGNEGHNTFKGGGGNNSYYDDKWTNETYIHNIGDGNDYISDMGGYDKVVFGEGQNIDIMRVSIQDGRNLQIWFEGIDGSLCIEDYFTDVNKRIERFEFADGSVIENIEEYLNVIESNGSIVLPEGYKQASLWGENDTIAVGNNQNNDFHGNSGNNTYIGKGGNDNFYDSQGGNDTYIYNLGDGYDYITDMGSENDTIVFGEGITPDMIKFERHNNGLNISFEGYEGSIGVHDYFVDPNCRIEHFVFADGTVIDNVDELMLSGLRSNEDIILPEEATYAEVWDNANTYIKGNAKDNFINSAGGNNTIEGGQGNDKIYDNGGNDTYVYNVGDGNDTINDWTGYDVIKFGEGITTDNIRFVQEAENLRIYFDGIEGCIVIENYTLNDDNKIERFELADGTVIEDITPYLTGIVSYDSYEMPSEGNINEVYLAGESDINATGNSNDNYLRGNNNNNIIDGNGGNDTIEGRGGNDTLIDNAGGNTTYIFNDNDGRDTIIDNGGYDTLRFGEGLSLDDIRISIQNSTSLEIWFNNHNCNIFIENYFNDENKHIERLEFADGTVIENLQDYINVIQDNNDITLPDWYKEAHLWGENDTTAVGDNSDNQIYGNSGNNTFEGKGGNDNIYDDQGGNDTFIYNLGDGNDRITNIGGYDTLKLGAGITFDMIRFNRQDNGNLKIWFEGQDGSIIIENHFNDSNFALEKIIFDDGSEIDDISSFFNYTETDEDYTLSEDSSSNELYATGNSNTTLTGNSQDNLISGNSGDNILEGKAGNDRLYDDKYTNETYIYNLGDGFDTICDVGGYDIIKFGEGLNRENLRIAKQNNNNLELWFDGQEGNIVIENFFNNNDNRIERFEFADGSIIENIEQFIDTFASDEDVILSEGIRDVHLRGENNISAVGNSMDNWIGGNSGDNTFEGKAGNDYFWDNQGGNDTFIYNLGDGYDYIVNVGGYDTIKFGKGINLEDIRCSIQNNCHLNIWFNNINGSITIEDFFSNPDKKIERFEFADGRVIENIEDFITRIEGETDITLPEGYTEGSLWGEGNTNLTGNDSDNQLNGNSGNNTFEGKRGNDNFWDNQGGDDTFIYNLGDGNDNIYNYNGYDVIKFGEGISPNMLHFQRWDNGWLNIYFDGVEGSITIQNYFFDDNCRIEKLIFADGTEVTDFDRFIDSIIVNEDYYLPEEDYRRNVYAIGNNDISITGNSQDNHFEGNASNNTYDGRGGNDNYYDPAGNDVYIYNQGDGWDYLRDESGNDVIRFGEGLEIRDFRGMIQNGKNLELSFNNQAGNIVIEDFFTNDNCKIERFEFADGSVITDISEFVIAMSSDNDIVLPDNIIEAHLRGENNTNATGNNNDNWIGGNSGNNIVEGKRGNDNYWDDQGGDDTLIYNIGDGDDTYENRGGYDTIQFGEGITQDMIRMEKFNYNEDIRIYFEGIEGSIYIRQYFSSDSEWKIERLLFADGSEITDFNPYLGITYTDKDFTIDEDSNISDVYAEGDSDITMVGNSRDNHFEGNNGNNTFKGGGGNNSFYDDRNTNETYIHNVEDGWDYITDMGGYDKVVFGEGLNKENMKVAIQNGSNLEIWFDGIDGNLVIEDYFSNWDKRIERFEFADGSVIEDMYQYLNVIQRDGDIILPNGYKEAHLWGENDFVAVGNDIDNHFSGNSGNNMFQGKRGNDDYYDDQGNETYIYNLGDGFDFINDRNGYDVIQLGNGISRDMIRMNHQNNGNLEIWFEGQEGNIVICDYFNDNNCKIEKIILADGTEITDFNEFFTFVITDQDYTIQEDSNILDVFVEGNSNITVTGNAQNNNVFGNEANNTYDLKGGNDNIYDPNGDDTYIYNRNDENLNIDDKGGFDTIKLGEGITEDQIGYMIDDYNNVHVRIADNNGEIMIQNQGSEENSKIEQIELADGTIINDINSRINQIGTEFNNIELPDGYTEAHLWGNQNLNATGNDLNNFMRGNAGDNILNGKGGNDYYWNYEGGNDTYIYNIGDGYDSIDDVNGYDRIQFGDGITAENIRFVRYDNNLNIHFDGFDGGISINGYFNDWEDRRIEEFVFSDGSSINDVSPFIQEADIVVPEPEPELPSGYDSNSSYDVNTIIQQMNSYAPDTDAVMTDSTLTQEEQILLAMAS